MYSFSEISANHHRLNDSITRQLEYQVLGRDSSWNVIMELSWSYLDILSDMGPQGWQPPHGKDGRGTARTHSAPPGRIGIHERRRGMVQMREAIQASLHRQCKETVLQCEELTRRMCTGGFIGSVSDLLKSADTRNDRCIPVAIFNHRREIY